MFNLSEILETKYEAEVLSFFLLAPPRAFYIEEISKRLEIPLIRLEEILEKMVENGQMKVFSKKSKKYYSLRADYTPFPQLKQALIKNKLNYQDELYTAVPKIGTISGCFLSGIFCSRPELPVDILIVGKVNEAKLNEFLEACEKLMGQELNYSVMTEEEFIVRRDTFDKFIKDIFDYPHLTVIDTVPKRIKQK